MRVLIENYRGFDITFDTFDEEFECIITEYDTTAKHSKSFSAMKTFVDEYKKKNLDFTPFWVEDNPDGYVFGTTKKVKIIGLRKDGQFIGEKENGDKIRISNSDLSGYMLVKPENVGGIEKLKNLSALMESQRIENNLTRKQIISTLNIVTLRDFKSTM